MTRNAWKSFEGFPKMNAALAYVYLVNQFKIGQIESKGDIKNDSSENEGRENSTGMDNGLGSGYVSTLKYVQRSDMSPTVDFVDNLISFLWLQVTRSIPQANGARRRRSFSASWTAT